MVEEKHKNESNYNNYASCRVSFSYGKYKPTNSIRLGIDNVGHVHRYYHYFYTKKEVEMIKLIQGDCLKEMFKLEDNSVNMILSDIPYGEVNRKDSGLRNLNKGEVDVCEIDLKEMVKQSVRVCDGSFYVFCGIKQISRITVLFQKYGLFTRLCVWSKTNPSPINGKHVWLSGLEFCVYCKKPNAVFNEFCKSALWSYPRGTSTEICTTQKPVPLMERLILASTNRNQTVLDFTMGSGTTGEACLNINRNFIGIELKKDRFNFAKDRIEKHKKLTDSYLI